MGNATAQDFIKAQHYTTYYMISTVLFLLRFIIFSYSTSHSYPHVLPSVSYIMGQTYNVIYPYLCWLFNWMTTISMALYNLGRESDEVIAKRFSNQLNKARRHKEKQVAAKPMSSISMALISIELMFRQTGANDLIQGNSVGHGIAKMLKYAMYRHFIFVWALQQARIKARSSRSSRNKSTGHPPVPYELFLYPRDRDAVKPPRTSRFKSLKDNVFKFFKLAYPKVLALLCQCIQAVKETLIEDWNIFVSFLVSARCLICDISSIVFENCKRFIRLAYTDCVTHVHVIWDNAAMIWKQILSCVEVGTSSIVSDLMVLYEVFIKMPIDVTVKFLVIIFSTTMYLRLWIDEDMAIVFTARVLILGNRRLASVSLFGVPPWVMPLFAVMELVKGELRKVARDSWNQLNPIIGNVKKSLVYALGLVVWLGEEIKINGMVVLYYLDVYLDMIKTKTTKTVYLFEHWSHSVVLDVIHIFGRLYAKISNTLRTYIPAIVRLKDNVFSKSQSEAERLRKMFDDYKIIVEQMVDRYTHLNSHRLVATQAALASMSSQYTRLLSVLNSAQRHSEELSNELMDTRYELRSYSVENKSLKNDVSTREQEVFELKQENSTLVRQVEELEGRNWGLSVKHTQERAILQRQIKEHADISASQGAWIDSVERERDEINCVLNEERTVHARTTKQLQYVKAELADSREEHERLQDRFDQDKAVINALRIQLEEEQHLHSKLLSEAHEQNQELHHQRLELGSEKEVALSELEGRLGLLQEQLTEEVKGKGAIFADLAGCKINELHLRNQVDILQKELDETKTQSKVVSVMKDAELEDLRRLLAQATKELVGTQVELCVRSEMMFELDTKVKALEVEKMAANDAIRSLESRIEDSRNDVSFIGDELYGNDYTSPTSMSLPGDLFSESKGCPVVRIIRTTPVALSECLDFGVDDTSPTTIASSYSFTRDTDCGIGIRLGHVFDKCSSLAPFIPPDEGPVEAENCNNDYGLFSTSLVPEDLHDDGVLASVNLHAPYRICDMDATCVTCDDVCVDDELLPVTVTVDEKLFSRMEYFVAVRIGHSTVKRGSGYTDIGISVADEVEDFSDDMLITTSVNLPPYLYWSTDALPVINIGGMQRGSTLGSSVSLDSLARIWTTGSINVDVCYSIQALDLAMTCVRVPSAVDENTEDWGDVVADSGIFMVDEGDHLPTSVTCPGWLYAKSTGAQVSQIGRSRAYSLSHVGEHFLSPILDDFTQDNTILSFDFPDNIPHGCALPDELLLASCL